MEKIRLMVKKKRISKEYKDIIKKALIVGHHKLESSGLHCNGVLKTLILTQYPQDVENIIEPLAEKICETIKDKNNVTAIVTFQERGQIFAYALALALRKRNCGEPRLCFVGRKKIDHAEYEDRFLEGHNITSTDNIIVFYDKRITGSSLVCLKRLCIDKGANIIGTAAIVDFNRYVPNNRQSQEKDLVSLINDFDAISFYKEENCPFCINNEKPILCGHSSI